MRVAAISVATDPKTGVICSLFHSSEDVRLACSFACRCFNIIDNCCERIVISHFCKYADFGSLLAHEILRTFQETYHHVDFTRTVTDKGQFSGFGAKIIDCIKSVLGAILSNRTSSSMLRAPIAPSLFLCFLFALYQY